MSDEKTGKNEAKGNSLTHWINDNNDDSNKSDSYTVLDHVCALYTHTKMKFVARAMLVVGGTSYHSGQ